MGAAAFEAPVLGMYAVGLGMLLTWQVLVGMQYGWKYTIGGVLSILSDAFLKFNVKVWRFGSGHPLKWIGHKVDEANVAVYRGIGHGAARAEHAAAYLFHAAGALQAWVTSEIAAWAELYEQGLRDLVTRDIPAARDDAVRIVQRQFRGIDDIGNRLRHWTETLLTRRLHALDRLWTQRLATFRRGIDRTIANTLTRIRTSIAHAVRDVAAVRGITVRQARRLAALERLVRALGVGTLAGLRARIGRVEGRVRTLERELAKAKTGATVAVGVGALWAALARMGLGFLRCRNVKRAGAATCGLPLEALEDLIAVGAIVGGTMGLLEFAREMEGVVETFAGVTEDFWQVD